MNTASFLNKENIDTIWDVISDEDIFRFLPRSSQNDVFKIFSKNIEMFYETEKTKTNNLIDINKKYILLILNYTKKTYPYEPAKIKILNEAPVKTLITYEEIQNDRKSQFDKDLDQRQQEFEDIMTVKPPAVPDFNDKYEDEPIMEMDKILKEMTAKRNYDVEQINRNTNTDANQSKNWLKSQETSLKSEKLIKEEPKKNVTWKENDDEQNIFNKLKRIVKKEDSPEDRMTKLETEFANLNEKIDKLINRQINLERTIEGMR
jgi:hypothetical protein